MFGHSEIGGSIMLVHGEEFLSLRKMTRQFTFFLLRVTVSWTKNIFTIILVSNDVANFRIAHCNMLKIKKEKTF